MEFTQELETGTFKMIGNTETSLKIREVADKCRLVRTDNGVKVELAYTGPNASKYMQYVEKHKEELTKYLMNPDEADLFEWMETSHQNPTSLKKHEKEHLILYVNFDPETRIVLTGIADENVTMKLGSPLMEISSHVTSSSSRSTTCCFLQMRFQFLWAMQIFARCQTFRSLRLI